MCVMWRVCWCNASWISRFRYHVPSHKLFQEREETSSFSINSLVPHSLCPLAGRGVRRYELTVSVGCCS